MAKAVEATMPATARAGKTKPHGRSEKLESISGLKEKVAAVVIAVKATSASQPIRAARRARVLSSPSVFTATQPAPWTTRAASASRPVRIVYQSRMPGFGFVGLKLVHNGWKK